MDGEVKQSYTEMELEFGRENLSELPSAFVERTKKQLKDIEKYLAIDNLQEESRAELCSRREKLKEAIKE